MVTEELIRDIEREINNWVIENKTSWKWLDKRGLCNAEEEGDCIFLTLKNEDVEENIIQELKESIRKVVDTNPQ